MIIACLRYLSLIVSMFCFAYVYGSFVIHNSYCWYATHTADELGWFALLCKTTPEIPVSNILILLLTTLAGFAFAFRNAKPYQPDMLDRLIKKFIQ